MYIRLRNLYACMYVSVRPVAESLKPIRAHGTIALMGQLFEGPLGANGFVKLRTKNQSDISETNELPIAIRLITLFDLNQRH